MAEVPGSAWRADYDVGRRDARTRRWPADWQARAGRGGARLHAFSAALTVFVAEIPAGTPAPGGCRWVALGDVNGEALPNVMRKVIAHGLGR